jgi:hypothetical protein
VIGSELSAFSLAPSNLSLFGVNDSSGKILCAMYFDSGLNGPVPKGWVTQEINSNSLESNLRCSDDTRSEDISGFLGQCDLDCQVLLSLQNYTDYFNHTINSPPVLISTNQGRIDSFTLIDDTKILHQYYALDPFNEWRLENSSNIFPSLDFASSPSITSKSKMNIDLVFYAQETNGNLFNASYNGKEWKKGKDLGQIPSPPSVVYWQNPERTYVFARDGSSLVYNWQGYK